MQIQEINIAGYRSVYEVDLKFDHVNIVSGANGCGKSNVFNAFRLLREAILGNLNQTLVAEGTLNSVLWAGPRKGPQVVGLKLHCEPYTYELELGTRPCSEQPIFPDDAQIRKEVIKLAGRAMIDRGKSVCTARTLDGQKETMIDLIDSISVFEQITDLERYPYLQPLQANVRRWALYHEFRTDAESPIRRSVGQIYPMQLAADGSNLAACLRIINRRGDWDLLCSRIDQALPGARLLDDRMNFAYDGLARPTTARELSDGTLKFLCLATACYFPHPPPLMVFNEPETSLSDHAVRVLAEMFADASSQSQLWVTTHSTVLAELLRDLTGARMIELEKVDGETVKVGGSRRGYYVAED